MLIKKNPKVLDTIKLTIKEFNKNYKGLCKIEMVSDGFELKNFDSLDVANFISLLTTHLEKKIKKKIYINPYLNLTSQKKIKFSNFIQNNIKL